MLILSRKIKYYTKEILKYFKIILISFGFIVAIILIKYKPIYQVSISGIELGYINKKGVLEENIKNKMIEEKEKNIDSVEINGQPEYKLKLINRMYNTNPEELIANMKDKINVTYKYYEVALNNDILEKVNTLEEAEELINKLITENQNLDLNITERYTQNEQEVVTTNIELAKQTISEKAIKTAEAQKQKKEQEEKLKSMPSVNGIKLATKPVSGTITSRYGASSRIRKSDHTGLDIATSSGTPIQVVADGTVTNASYKGSYGNIVKVDHGNNVETWYAHTKKMNVIVGQKVKAGDTIATVGSTGNSTGPHLHFEIRINGKHINPQEYLYK